MNCRRTPWKVLESDLPCQDTTNNKTKEKDNGNPIGGNADVVEKLICLDWKSCRCETHTHTCCVEIWNSTMAPMMRKNCSWLLDWSPLSWNRQGWEMVQSRHTFEGLTLYIGYTQKLWLFGSVMGLKLSFFLRDFPILSKWFWWYHKAGRLKTFKNYSRKLY